MADQGEKVTFENMHRFGRLQDAGQEIDMNEAFYVACRSVRDFRSREAAALALADTVRAKLDQLSLTSPDPDRVDRANADKLVKGESVSIGPILDNGQVRDVLSYLMAKDVYPMYGEDRRPFRADRPRDGVVIGRYSLQDIARAPHLLHMLLHPRLLGAATAFLGALPTVSICTFVWSFATGQEAQNMQLFHRDNDDFRQCKAFVLLTDTLDAQDGPHVHVRHSVDQDMVRRRLEGRGIAPDHREDLLHRLFDGVPNHRYADSLVEEAFGPESVDVLTGRAGDCFMENTWGIHKGLPPRRAPRLVLQIQYALQPSLFFTYEPVAIPGMDRLSAEDRYVCRAYLKAR